MKKPTKKAKKAVPKPQNPQVVEDKPLAPLEELFEQRRKHEEVTRGHPTDLTMHTFRESIKLFGSGVPESMIGPSLKPPLGRSVVGDWKTRGREDAKEGLRTIFSEFSVALREAEPLQEEANLAYIAAARGKDWRAAAQLLKWRYPRKYSDKFIMTPPAPAQGTPPVSTASTVFVMSPEERAARLDRVRGILGAAAAVEKMAATPLPKKKKAR